MGYSQQHSHPTWDSLLAHAPALHLGLHVLAMRATRALLVPGRDERVGTKGKRITENMGKRKYGEEN